jgi:hypothetical protein
MITTELQEILRRIEDMPKNEKRLRDHARQFPYIIDLTDGESVVTACLAGAEALRLVREFVSDYDHMPNCSGWRGPENEQWHVGGCDCACGKMRALLATGVTR